MTFKDPKQAFSEAIQSDRLSANPGAPYYAGNYMYMGTDATGLDQFKHKDLRTYLPAKHVEFFNDQVKS